MELRRCINSTFNTNATSDSLFTNYCWKYTLEFKDGIKKIYQFPLKGCK